MSPALPGSDGRLRCGWAVSSVEYERYHDQEWGVPGVGERGLYERLSLEAFQAGLSWLTVLRKRPALRLAFAGFDPVVVAGFGAQDVERLMTDPGIIRHRGKIEAMILNARAVLALPEGTSLTSILEAHRPPVSAVPVELSDVPTMTRESSALARELRRLGFRFVGPTTAYAMLQATGYVDDHLRDCWVRGSGVAQRVDGACADGAPTR